MDRLNELVDDRTGYRITYTGIPSGWAMQKYFRLRDEGWENKLVIFCNNWLRKKIKVKDGWSSSDNLGLYSCDKYGEDIKHLMDVETFGHEDIEADVKVHIYSLECPLIYDKSNKKFMLKDNIKESVQESGENEASLLDLDDFQSMVDDEEITQEEADIARNINWEINDNDIPLFIEQMRDHLELKEISSVTYADPNNDEFGGAYAVTTKDANTFIYAWKDGEMGLTQLRNKLGESSNNTLNNRRKNLELKVKSFIDSLDLPLREVTDKDLEDWD